MLFPFQIDITCLDRSKMCLQDRWVLVQLNDWLVSLLKFVQELDKAYICTNKI
jgi:hypothetical protein